MGRKTLSSRKQSLICFRTAAHQEKPLCIFFTPHVIAHCLLSYSLQTYFLLLPFPFFFFFTSLTVTAFQRFLNCIFFTHTYTLTHARTSTYTHTHICTYFLLLQTGAHTSRGGGIAPGRSKLHITLPCTPGAIADNIYIHLISCNSENFQRKSNR